MKRVPTLELLDTNAGTPAEVAASLADLRMINRWFGGVDTTVRLIQRVAGASNAHDGGASGVLARQSVHGAPDVPARLMSGNPARPLSLSLLDVASGTGYVPHAASEQLLHQGLHLEVTLLDRIGSHFNGGTGASTNGTRLLIGNALSLPLRDSSFDLVSSVLFVHHLGPDELVCFVNESLRVCRQAVLINDLIRDPLHLALVYSGFPLYRSRLTRNDAPASVRQAYTQDEMRDILNRTNAARVEIDSHYLYRMAVVAWKE